MANRIGTAMAPIATREFMAFDPFRNVEERMRRFFGEGYEPFKTPTEENWSLATWAPTCDIFETDNEIVVKAELPEVKNEDVRVTIDNNMLTIRGERKFSEETKKDSYHRMERSYGEFFRSFTLPQFIDATKVGAEFKNGILRITLPKREEAKPKQLEVKVK
jgi:HSP20 family protein